MNDIPKNRIPPAYKWFMLLFLWGAFFFNQGDRQLFNNVLGLIEDDMGFSPVQLGWVATLFTICYGLFVPLAGWLGDAIQKRLVVFLSLLIFSLGTLMTGLVPHADTITNWLPGGGPVWLTGTGLCLTWLVVARSVATGLGEAFYYPAANSMVAQYHPGTRATAMAIHQTANYTGVVFGGTLSAAIAYSFGWRSAFYVFGGIGVVWSLVILLLFRNDHTDLALTSSPAEKKVMESSNRSFLKEALKAILSRPTFYLLSLAFGGMCFVNVGFLTWVPRYLVHEFGVSGVQAGFNATFYHHLAAYISLFIGAGIADGFARRILPIRLYVEFVGLLFGMPFIYIMGMSNDLMTVYIAIGLFGLFRGLYDSNLFAALFDIIEPVYRSTASGLMLSFAFVIGAFAPVVLALVAKKYDNDFGPGLAWLSVGYLFSAFCILLAILFFYKQDRIAADRGALAAPHSNEPTSSYPERNSSCK